MIKEIKAGDIPDWKYGDVAIKTFSFGDKLALADLRAKINKDGNAVDKEDISIQEVTIVVLAAGLQYVKQKDALGFLINQTNTLEEKKKIVYDFEFSSGEYLLHQIQEINKPLDPELKKKLS